MSEPRRRPSEGVDLAGHELAAAGLDVERPAGGARMMVPSVTGAEIQTVDLWATSPDGRRLPVQVQWQAPWPKGPVEGHPLIAPRSMQGIDDFHLRAYQQAFPAPYPDDLLWVVPDRTDRLVCEFLTLLGRPDYIGTHPSPRQNQDGNTHVSFWLIGKLRPVPDAVGDWLDGVPRSSPTPTLFDAPPSVPTDDPRDEPVITPETEGLLRAAEVAVILGVSEATVYRLRRTGELAGATIGRRVVFHRNDVEAYIRRIRTR